MSTAPAVLPPDFNQWDEPKPDPRLVPSVPQAASAAPATLPADFFSKQGPTEMAQQATRSAIASIPPPPVPTGLAPAPAPQPGPVSRFVGRAATHPIIAGPKEALTPQMGAAETVPVPPEDQRPLSGQELLAGAKRMFTPGATAEAAKSIPAAASELLTGGNLKQIPQEFHQGHVAEALGDIAGSFMRLAQMLGRANVEGSIERGAEGSAITAKTPGGRFAAGVQATPEAVRGAVKAGETTAGVEIPRAQPAPPSHVIDATATGKPVTEGMAERGLVPRTAEAPPPGAAEIGSVEPETGREIVQPTNDVQANQQLATQAAPDIASNLEGSVKGIPGVQLVRARPAKTPDRLEDKMEGENQPPETVKDYSGLMIAADSPEAKNQAIAAISKQFKLVKPVEDNFEKPDPKNNGWRAAVLQVQAPNGSTHEIQIVPREQYEHIDESHQHYAASRDAEMAGNDKLAKQESAAATRINDQAAKQFEDRNSQFANPDEALERREQQPSTDVVTVYRGSNGGSKAGPSGVEYFSPDKDYAQKYGKNVRSEKLNVKNFFDPNRPEHRTILDKINSKIEPGHSILTDPANGLPLYSDATRLHSLLKDAGYDFDGLALSENAGVMGHGGVSYARFTKHQPDDTLERREVYPYASTQTNLPPDLAQKVTSLAQRIPDQDLAPGEGREDQPHITVKYGLHEADPDVLRQLLASEKPVTVKLGKTSVFPASETGGNYDVVKVDVDSPELHRLNQKVAGAFEHTDTHPEYKPHVTLAYVKPGHGQKYAGMADLEGQTATLNSIELSDHGKRRYDIPIGPQNGQPPSAEGANSVPQAKAGDVTLPNAPGGSQALQKGSPVSVQFRDGRQVNGTLEYQHPDMSLARVRGEDGKMYKGGYKTIQPADLEAKIAGRPSRGKIARPLDQGKPSTGTTYRGTQALEHAAGKMKLDYVPPSKPDEMGVIYTDRNGQFILSQIDNSKSMTWSGKTYPPAKMDKVLGNLKGVMGSAYLKSPLQRLWDTLSQAQQENGKAGVAVVVNENSQDVPQTAEHEMLHGGQNVVGEGHFAGHTDSQFFMDHPKVLAAASALFWGAGYPLRPEIMSAEIPAYILSKEGHRTGLDLDEQVQVMEHYRQSLIRKHGEQAFQDPKGVAKKLLDAVRSFAKMEVPHGGSEQQPAAQPAGSGGNAGVSEQRGGNDAGLRGAGPSEAQEANPGNTAEGEKPEQQLDLDLQRTELPKGSTVALREQPFNVKGSGKGGKVLVADVAAALQKFTRSQLKPLHPLDNRAEKLTGRAADIASSELEYQLAQENTGVDWYDKDIDRYIAAFQQMHPEMKKPAQTTLAKAITACMSLGNNNYITMKNLDGVYGIFKETGKLPIKQPSGKFWPGQGYVNVKSMTGPLVTLQSIIDKRGQDGAAKWLLEKHPISELREFNKNTSGKASDIDYGAMALGDKAGPFFLNMNGIKTKLTTDMWFTRMWNRWMGTLVNDDGSLNEAPRNPSERKLMLEGIEKAAPKMGLTVDVAQAVLWYYEQQLYKSLGVRAESGSYGDAAERLLSEKNAGDSGRPQEAGQDAAARESARGNGGSTGGVPTENRSGPRRESPSKSPLPQGQSSRSKVAPKYTKLTAANFSR